jgi:hypothetical protein
MFWMMGCTNLWSTGAEGHHHSKTLWITGCTNLWSTGGPSAPTILKTFGCFKCFSKNQIEMFFKKPNRNVFSLVLSKKERKPDK